MDSLEIDKTIRELRIEWDDILDSTYNPLSLAVSLTNPSSQTTINYRNSYHKLERLMQRIIEISYEGFSNSVLSYKNIFQLNNDIIYKLDEIKVHIYNIKKIFSINLDNLKKEKGEINVYKNMVDILQKIHEMTTLVDKIDENNLVESSYNILKSFNLSDDLKDIKVVKYSLDKINKNREKLEELVCNKISGIIFENKDTGIADVKCIYILNAFESCDKKMAERTSNEIFINLEKIIENVSKMEFITKNDRSKDEDDEKYSDSENFKMRVLARKICSYFKCVIKNFDSVMKKIDFYAIKNTNFFDKDFNDTKFFKREPFIEILKNEIFRLVNVYSIKRSEDRECLFSLSKVNEKVDIQNIFGSNSYLKNKIGMHTDIQANSFRTEYKLIFDPNYDFVYFLYENIFEEIKEDLRVILNENFFKYKTKNNFKKMNSIFDPKSFYIVEDGKLSVHNKLKKFISQNSIYEVEFSYHPFIEIIEKIYESFDKELNSFYKAKIIHESFVIKKEEDIPDLDNKKHFIILRPYEIERKFKELTIRRSISKEETMSDKFSYKKCKLLAQTVSDIVEYLKKIRLNYEKIQKDEKLEKIFVDLHNLEIKYKTAFQLQVTVDIFYYFDLFYRQGKFGKNDQFLAKIVKIYEELNFVEVKKQIKFFDIMDILKYYCLSNLNKLNVRSEDDLKMFVEDVKMLEEITMNFEMEYEVGFEDLIMLLEDVLKNNLDTSEKEKIARRIHLKKSKNE